MWGFFFFYRMNILHNFKLNWAVQPISRVLLLFFIGLLLAYYLPFNFWYVSSGVVACLFSILFVYRSFSYRRGLLIGFLLALVISGSGVFVGQTFVNQKQIVSSHIQYNQHFFLAKISSEVVPKDSLFSFNADYYLSDSNGLLGNRLPFKVRTSFIGENFKGLKIGQFYLVHCKLNLPQPPLISGEFNYAEYLKRNGVFATTRISDSDVFLFDHSEFSVKQFFIDFRNVLINSLQKQGLKGDELAIASALLLGARSEISEELNLAYTSSGITHILAVSGMHVGLVFAAVTFFLKRIKNKIYCCILSLLFLWGYACLTGLSPSVIRAAWMFSFIACGKLFRSGHQKWNSISASALLMLVLDPFIWLDAGFQLSFSAVWGIVAMGQLPAKWMGISKWFKYPIEAAWISCIAQVSTLPVSLYIFGKFPIYFLLANLLTVPLSTVLTYWGILCFLVIPIPAVAAVFCKILSLGIQLMNSIASFIGALPSSLMDGFNLSLIHSIWLGIILYLISSKFLTKHQKFITAAAFTCFFSALLWTNLLKAGSSLTTLYFSNNDAGVIFNRGTTKRNYIVYGSGKLSRKSIASYEKYWISSPNKFSGSITEQSQMAQKSFILSSNQENSSKVLFIHPSDKHLNPFLLGSALLDYRYVLIFPGGNFKWRQFWRLACARNRVSLFEIKHNRFTYKEL